jgi:hypothetical protein
MYNHVLLKKSLGMRNWIISKNSATTLVHHYNSNVCNTCWQACGVNFIMYFDCFPRSVFWKHENKKQMSRKQTLFLYIVGDAHNLARLLALVLWNSTVFFIKIFHVTSVSCKRDSYVYGQCKNVRLF